MSVSCCSPAGGHVVVEVGDRDGCAVVRFVGEVDLDTIEQVGAALRAAAAEPVHHLEVDLGAADFLSLSVLAMIADLGPALARRGGRMTVTRARPLHHRVLGMLGTPVAAAPVDGAVG